MLSHQKPLAALGLSLALLLQALPAVSAADAPDIDLTSQTDAQCHYLPPAGAQTVSYYFAMPREWCGEHTDRAGVNWTYRENGGEETAPVCRVAAGFAAWETDKTLQFRADVPDYLDLTDEYRDVSLRSLTWTNLLRDNKSDEFCSLTLDMRDLTSALTDAESESVARDERLFAHGGNDAFWRSMTESYLGDRLALGDYAGNFYITFENDPDGRLCLRRDNMLYLPERGDWFFRFDSGRCGTYPTEEESLAHGECFTPDISPAPTATAPEYPSYRDYHGDAPATADEGGFREGTETVGGFLCYFGRNSDTDEPYVRIDAYCGEDAEITIPETVNGVPVTAWSLGEAPSVTALTLPASLADASNRDGLSGLNRLPCLESVALDGENGLCTVTDNAVYLSDGTVTELIAAARRREGSVWTIPDGVNAVAEGVACDTVRTLRLPASIESIGAELSLPALENVEVAPESSAFSVTDGALYRLDASGRPEALVLLPEQSGIEALVVPEGVRQVGKLRCDTLQTLSLPASAQTVTTFSQSSVGSSSLPALRTITVAAGNPCFTAVDGVLYGVDSGIDEASGAFIATDGGKPAYFAACPDSYQQGTLSLPDTVRGFTDPLTSNAVKTVVFPAAWDADSEGGDILRFLGGREVAVVCPPDSAALRYCEEHHIPFTLSVLTTGDVNGDGAVNITDATLTQQIAAEATAPTAAQKTAADVNRDGRVDVNDATLIQKFAADVIRSFE